MFLGADTKVVRQNEMKLSAAQRGHLRGPRGTQNDAVVSDDKLQDIPDAVFGAILFLSRRHGTGGRDDVRRSLAEAGAKNLDPASRAG